MQKLPKVFECKICDYITGRSHSLAQHLLTRKHDIRTKMNKNEQINGKYSCKICNKEYNARNSLWYHEQKCSIKNETKTGSEEIKSLTNLVIELVKNNTDLQSQLKESIKNMNTYNENNRN